VIDLPPPGRVAALGLASSAERWRRLETDVDDGSGLGGWVKRCSRPVSHVWLQCWSFYSLESDPSEKTSQRLPLVECRLGIAEKPAAGSITNVSYLPVPLGEPPDPSISRYSFSLPHLTPLLVVDEGYPNTQAWE